MRSIVTALLAAGLFQAAALAPAAEVTLRPAVTVPHADKARLLASARAGQRIVAVGEHGIVLLSDDGGRTHRQARTVPVDVVLTGVHFVDAQRGWAVGHAGAILATADGGETWRVQRSDTANDRPLFAVHFFDERNGVAVGLWSLVLVTGDGGTSWQAVDMPLPPGAKKADLNLLGLFADGKGHLFAVGEKGMVVRSDDRGAHWRYAPTGYKGSFWAGTATPAGTLIVAGLRGSMYRSSDEGASWTRVETGTKSSITAITSAGGHIVAVGMDGLVLRSADDGASFTVHLRADRASLSSVLAGADGRAVLYQVQGGGAPGEAAAAR